MHFYDPVSKIIKADLSAEVDAWLAEGNQIKVLDGYNQENKAAHHTNNDELIVNKAKIAQLNTWLVARAGRVTKLNRKMKLSVKLFSNIRRGLCPCKVGLYKKFEEQMAIIEQGERK